MLTGICALAGVLIGGIGFPIISYYYQLYREKRRFEKNKNKPPMFPGMRY